MRITIGLQNLKKEIRVKYNNHLNYRDRRRLLIKLRIVYSFLALAIIGGGLAFYFLYVKEQNPNDNSISATTNSVVAPKISLFKSPYFQFQANNSWKEVTSESTTNKFVYRSYNNTLLEHELVVYVNQIPNPEDFKSTRVLPVSVVSSGGQTSHFSMTQVSDPCTSALNPAVKPPDVQNVTFKNVNFMCYGKINEYNVLVGLIGGNTNLTMKRADGSTAVYTIQYKDLRAINGPTEINQIVSSFQSI